MEKFVSVKISGQIFIKYLADCVPDTIISILYGLFHLILLIAYKIDYYYLHFTKGKQRLGEFKYLSQG